MHIKNAIYLISSPSVEDCPVPDRPEYAFIGRSNVGKSSLLNMLCNNEKLAKTSNSPGKTQMINHFKITSSQTMESRSETEWYLVDLPGYGFAKTSLSNRRRWEQMIENYLRKRENLVSIFVLVDSRHEPQKIDIAFVQSLVLWNVPFSLVFTKTDKEKQRTVSKNVKDFFEEMKGIMQFLPHHFLTSSIKKSGREKILNFIAEKNEELKGA
ncbi:MAG: ribosome biogenesis GTP-binding protein YihA/YsxC [Ginsengibacter sp.]